MTIADEAVATSRGLSTPVTGKKRDSLYVCRVYLRLRGETWIGDHGVARSLSLMTLNGAPTMYVEVAANFRFQS